MKYVVIHEHNVVMRVTPCAGVWIEIAPIIYALIVVSSLPVRECGLKFARRQESSAKGMVTPCAGVWIEIKTGRLLYRPGIVTPCAGVWIEIEIVDF